MFFGTDNNCAMKGSVVPHNFFQLLEDNWLCMLCVLFTGMSVF